MNTLYHLISEFRHLGIKDFWIILAILVMDAALSADNSVAINALAKNVAPRLQSSVIWIGLGLAAILRVVAIGFAAFIIENPWVQVLGAFYLMYLFYGHFFGGKDGDEDSEHSSKSSNFWAVIVGIGILDLSLSTDNVIAVVAMSQNFAVIVIGVLCSILLLAIASQVVRKIMERIPSLEGAAYVILLFLACIMLAGHTADTIVWVGTKLHNTSIISHQAAILHYKWNVSDMLEILGVFIILCGAVALDKMKKTPVAA